MSLIKVNHVEFSYPHTNRKILDGIDFEINEGEYVALVGFNGSGKSTFLRVISGFLEPTGGTVEFADNLRPGIVFQQPKEQIVAGVVERDTSFGPDNLRCGKHEKELRTIESLSVVSILDKAFNRTFELSLGQTQRLAFSGILALFPHILILDEVTSMIDCDARMQLMEFISNWHSKGHTILHVTHDLDEALRADRVIVLEEGKITGDMNKSEFEKNTQLLERLFGKEYEYGEKSAGKEVVLKVENAGFEYDGFKVFSSVSFELKKGTLVSITGPSGCGKSTLFECLAGLKSLTSGKILAASRPVLSLQESEAALFEPFAADDVAFGPSNKGMKGRELYSTVKKSMDLVGLDYKKFGNCSTFNLSGGEKRKLSIAGIIAMNEDIMIFDEPTAGADSISRKNILLMLKNLARSGKTVLYSTHRNEEADVADVSLKWNDLFAETEKSEFENLPEVKLLSNASLLDKISGISRAFISPPKIEPSPVSRLNAGVKTLLFSVLFIVSLIEFNPWLSFAMVGVNFLYALLARFPLKRFFIAFSRLLPWVLIFVILEMVFVRSYEGDIIYMTWNSFVITDRKINFIYKTVARAASMILIVSTYIYSTNEQQVMNGVSAMLKPLALLKVPVRYAVIIIGIFLRFVPLLLDELSGIIKTQLIRGALSSAKGLKKIKLLIPVFVPLVLQTFRKAQYLADALTARYF